MLHRLHYLSDGFQVVLSLVVSESPVPLAIVASIWDLKVSFRTDFYGVFVIFVHIEKSRYVVVGIKVLWVQLHTFVQMLNR